MGNLFVDFSAPMRTDVIQVWNAAKHFCYTSNVLEMYIISSDVAEIVDELTAVGLEQHVNGTHTPILVPGHLATVQQKDTFHVSAS